MKQRGRKIQHAAPSGSRSIDNTQGSPLWSYNHYRSRMLTCLLNDLIDIENEGLEESTCEIVQKSLAYFVNVSTEIPSGGFLTGPLYKEVQKFEETYKKWNAVNGRDAEAVKQRRKILMDLRKKRQNISTKVRALQFELHTNLDTQLLASSYKAIGELVNLVPNLFVNLGSGFRDYIKRGGQVTNVA